MDWRDQLIDSTQPPAKAGARQPRAEPKYRVGQTVQTHYTAWPNNTMTEHTVQRIWSCADGYAGASDYAYHLIPAPRGSNHRPLDEGWLSVPTVRPYLRKATHR